MELINKILDSCLTDDPVMSPTILYNEGWMLRLTLEWFSTHSVSNYPLSFSTGARWYSEAMLPTAFAARYRGDKLGEARTHLYGMIGHFAIGNTGKADFSLSPVATQFVALEAKLNSRLSSKTTNVSYFDQAARNVASIAESLCNVNRLPVELSTLGFYVIAPASRIKQGIFAKFLEHEVIMKKVKRRVDEYQGTKDSWYSEWFLPTLENMSIDVLSWEEVIKTIEMQDPNSGSSLNRFYHDCLRFNANDPTRENKNSV